MDSFTAEELRQAADRVREMQRRASINTNPTQNKKTPTAQNKEPVSVKNSLAPKRNLLELINFKNMEIDSDRSLLMGILLLLTSDTADEILMFALIYIMM